MILKGSIWRIRAALMLFIALLVSTAVPLSLRADEAKKDNSIRGIFVAPEYTGVVIPRAQELSLDLTVKNKGKRKARSTSTCGNQVVLIAYLP